MGPARVVSIVFRVAALTVLLFVCFALGSMVVQTPAAASQSGSGQGNAAAILLMVCFLDVCVLAFLILRSRWSGWKLIATIWMALFAVATLLPQIETLVFPTVIPAGMLPRLLLMGLISSLIFSPLAVLVLGKARRSLGSESAAPWRTPNRELAWRLPAIAVIYVLVYFSFGYFIAWKSAAVRAYYGGSDPGTFLVQMKHVIRDTPRLILFQIVRGILWGLVALPVIRMMKGARWEAGLAVALLFSVVMSDKLLLPNPYMPEAVRMAHLAETASSNFLFGWLVAWLLTKARERGTPVSAAAVAHNS